MNKRIKELWEQSRTSGVHPKFGDYDKYSVEKFAELIIKECFVQMEKESRNCSMLMSYPPQSSAIWDAKNNIRKHFGVEE